MPGAPPEFLERFLAFSAALGPAALIAVILSALGARTLPKTIAGLALIMGPFAGLSSLAGIVLMPFIDLLDPPIPAAMGQAFLGAALPEELAKFAILVTIVLRHHDADRGRDAVLAAAWLGLGFAAFENFFYVTSAKDWLSTGALRFATAVPFHVALGMIMGMFLAANDKGHAPSATILALTVPVLLHGLYDWPLFALEELKDPGPKQTLLYNGLFAAVMLATGALICLPVASVLHRQAWRSARPYIAYGPLLDGTARAISLLLRLGATICAATAIVAAISLDREYLHLAAMAIMPFAFGEFWRRAAA